MGCARGTHLDLYTVSAAHYNYHYNVKLNSSGVGVKWWGLGRGRAASPVDYMGSGEHRAGPGRQRF